MGSLSNLYISQSYTSLLHLGSDTTASATLTPIEDGLGNGIGVSVNTAGDVALAGQLTIKRGLDITGSVKINTAVTASTQQFVNSGNQFTDNIIRITGSYDSGSTENPSVYQIQNGWKCYGPGLGDDGATVIANDYVPATGWRFTIDKNTAVWFGLYNFTDPNVQYYNFAVSGSEDITGSLWVRDKITVTDISASGDISASNLWIKNKIHAYEIDTTIISSSIVFTSGSNIIGDNANEDVQLIIGRIIQTGSVEITGSTRINGNTTITGSTIISGSSVSIISSNTSINSNTSITGSTQISGSTSITGSTRINGSTDITGSLKVSSDISSSTLNGVGNVTLYSASVNSRVTSLENFSSSLVATFATVAQLNASSSALQSNINTKLDTASFNSYTSSLSSSTSLTSASFNSRINNIIATSATTGSNTFVGNQVITGSLILSSSAATDLTVIGNQIITGSLRGNVVTLSPVTSSISASTVTMDCSLANFFTLTLPTASTATINATNIQPGETVQLRVRQQSVTGSVTLGTGFNLTTGSIYEASNVANKVDILSFISFDTASLYTVFVRTFN